MTETDMTAKSQGYTTSHGPVRASGREPGHIPAHWQALELHALAQREPQLWGQLARHPNAYPALLDWLAKHGNADVKSAVAERRGEVATTPSDEPAGATVARVASTRVMDPADDRTVLAKRHRRPLALLRWGHGESVQLHKPLVLIGRRVEPGEQEAQVVQVSDSTRTVSGIHARLALVDDAWTIEDLNSTNGIFLVNEDGEEEVRGRAIVVNDFYLGDVRFHLEPRVEPEAASKRNGNSHV